MTHADRQIVFTALGFLAVILRNVPEEKQASRALGIATLIESFCSASLPGAFPTRQREEHSPVAGS